MKIALFGGSFDPVHRAHHLLAKNALTQFDLDRVIWIPAFISPLKKGNRVPAASGLQRLEMVRLVCKSEPKFEVSNYEIQKGGKSYTIDTLRYFKKKFRNTSFFWILGQDALTSLPQWKEFKTLMQEITFLVAGRAGAPNAIPQGCRASQIQMDSCDISSTAVRRELTANKGWNFLDSSVAAYIRDHRLYTGKP